ncbi:2-dehydropantoate 2-reductase N-terminal domain-containing protein [Gordonia sp. ABSL1-1]|uniref:ketopantoate reductase family protein n=1 Tax=Gordonia sp. ABSL1-1 TaxID=3053923 RepID=UPI002572858C|nr:2-dehydropantoate 2-reductase N-terminal domain-containing protein [Gordonia sp. ABSL1-1]MDL9937292.1 2-dehydropantoate 2-reductase N-terminal domain-containing protein [Gordonia sp. ABSL1-1]
MSRRYIVIGAGAVGAALAAGLEEADLPVVLVSRGATFAAIADGGLTYTQAGRTRRLGIEVVSGPDGVDLGPDDVLVFATKTQDAAEALAAWAYRPVVGGAVAASLPVVLLQNGLDAERAALRYFDIVIGAVTLVAAKHVVAGVVDVANAPKIGQIIVGPYPFGAGDDGSAVAAEIASDLRAANWLSQSVADIRRWLAWKMLVSAEFALAVLAGDADERAILAGQIRTETTRVLAAAGYEIADPGTEVRYDPAQAALSADSAYRPGQLSTWQSFQRGSGSEVDFLNGEIALLARELGVPVPSTIALQRTLGASAALGEAPGTRTVAEVLDLAGLEVAQPA